jgi:hypothetical protein
MKIQHLMALVVLSLATVPGARAAVLAGPLTNAANAHLYYLLSANTWTASEAEAVGLGGHLVTINDAAENQWVLNTFFPLTGAFYASLWIGLNDAANEGQFCLGHGEPVTFTYWYSGEPNNAGLSGEDYATIRHPSERPDRLVERFGEHPERSDLWRRRSADAVAGGGDTAGGSIHARQRPVERPGQSERLTDSGVVRMGHVARLRERHSTPIRRIR